MEYELLVASGAGARARIFSRGELLRDIWGFRSAGLDKTVDSHASRLRRRLAPGADPGSLSVRGVGYPLT